MKNCQVNVSYNPNSLCFSVICLLFAADFIGESSCKDLNEPVGYTFVVWDSRLLLHINSLDVASVFDSHRNVNGVDSSSSPVADEAGEHQKVRAGL